ncbi:MAG: tRNA C34 N-acetyltransferase TmcA [Methanophagales archaeon]|nr:tRNA(Met) cytidine acetyltransferase TmcA [Methanophagales archaeon]MCU4139118.1 tRNA C34 N-acetyltransferase TmcA [Methanophagales archaeon]
MRLSRELSAELERAAKNALKNRHRFMLMLCTSHLESDVMKLAEKLYKKYEKIVEKFEEEVRGREKEEGEKKSEGAEKSEEKEKKENKKENKELLIVGRTKFLDIASAYFKGKFVHFADSERLLGETYASLILDLTEGFHPNDLGIIVETIAAGGMILAVAPPLDAWSSLRGKWHEELVSEPFSLSQVVPRFYRRFAKRTLAAEGIIIYDFDEKKLVKRYEFGREGAEKDASEAEKGISEALEAPKVEIKIPEERKIKKKLYKLCATQDQVEFLRLMERFFERKKARKAVILTADRGRGKTAVLGIVTPFLISRMYAVLKRPVRIILVAPSPAAVQTFFVFLRKALIRQGMRKFKSKETAEGLTTVVSTKYARVEYVIPRRALVEKELADIIIVDEAAAIDVSVLRKITEGSTYTIFSSTIHGYEGAGRGFSVRFLKYLEADADVELERMHMEEPIRYGKGDPIEKWLNDVLLLDAKPAELSDEDIRAVSSGEMKFEQLDKDAISERILREFFGIYVLAHYRNRPSDVAILLDMPNHFAFRVSVNGKTICSLHIAVEGGLSSEMIEKMKSGFKPRGQMIPDLMLKHYWMEDFPKLKGVRIVRIATHPALMRRGIGSFALRELLKWASSFDWVGAGFGVSPELLRFWLRNGFLPAHITPQRNEISGEHTVVVLKASNFDLEAVNAEFVRRLVEYLCDELRDLETETALGLIRSIKRKGAPKISLGNVERCRMQKYLEGFSAYEYIADIARPLVKAFYCAGGSIDIDERDERVLVAKCLQLKSWREIEEEETARHAHCRKRGASGHRDRPKQERGRKGGGSEQERKEGKSSGNARNVAEMLRDALRSVWNWYESEGCEKGN